MLNWHVQTKAAPAPESRLKCLWPSNTRLSHTAAPTLVLVLHLQAVQGFVRQAMGYVDETPDQATKVELIKTLQSVTEGKVRAAVSVPLLVPGRACGASYSSPRGAHKSWRTEQAIQVIF